MRQAIGSGEARRHDQALKCKCIAVAIVFSSGLWATIIGIYNAIA